MLLKNSMADMLTKANLMNMGPGCDLSWTELSEKTAAMMATKLAKEPA